MSKILPPRTTRPGMCTAYGCPLLGTLSASTAGGDWWCFAHHGKDVGRFQRITADLHRLKWLIQAISDVRTREQHVDYPAAFQRIEHDFILAQRKDLLWTTPESVEEWLIRLERELTTMLAEPPPQKQDALPLQTA
ncbi:MAG: hypothetical protein V4641_01755 [Pseudomonadota bacterium]